MITFFIGFAVGSLLGFIIAVMLITGKGED